MLCAVQWVTWINVHEKRSKKAWPMASKLLVPIFLNWSKTNKTSYVWSQPGHLLTSGLICTINKLLYEDSARREVSRVRFETSFVTSTEQKRMQFGRKVSFLGISIPFLERNDPFLGHNILFLGCNILFLGRNILFFVCSNVPEWVETNFANVREQNRNLFFFCFLVAKFRFSVAVAMSPKCEEINFENSYRLEKCD